MTKQQDAGHDGGGGGGSEPALVFVALAKNASCLTLRLRRLAKPTGWEPILHGQPGRLSFIQDSGIKNGRVREMVMRKKLRKRIVLSDSLRKYLCVSSKKKLRAKLDRFTADTNWTLADAEMVLVHHGFAHVGGEGSHRVYSHPTLDQPVVLAAHGKGIKPCYIRTIRQAIQDLPQ